MNEIEIILEKEGGEKEITLEKEGNVSLPSLENLEVTPSKEQQVFKHENSYGYDKVTVEPIPNEYIIPNGTTDIIANGYYQVSRGGRGSERHRNPELRIIPCWRNCVRVF